VGSSHYESLCAYDGAQGLAEGLLEECKFFSKMEQPNTSYAICPSFSILKGVSTLRVRRGGEPLWKYSINPASGHKLADVKGLICSLERSSYVM